MAVSSQGGASARQGAPVVTDDNGRGALMLETMIHEAPDAVVLTDASGRVTHWNARAEELFGYPADRAVGVPVARLIVPPELRAAHERGMVRASRAAARGRAHVSLHLEAMRHDGRRVPIELNLRTLRGSDGPVFGAFVRDMSRQLGERREAQLAREALAEGERRLAEAQQIASVGSYDWDLASDEVHWSDELCEIFGRERADAPTTAEAVWALVHPEDRSRLRAAVHTARTEGSSEGEHRIVRPDGSVRWVFGRRRLVGGTRLAGTMQDVTDRRAVEAERRAAEDTFRQSFEHAPVGIGLIAPDGRWTLVNRALCVLTGHTADALVGTSARRLLGADEPEEDLAYVRDLLAGRLTTFQVDRKARHADGRELWVQVSGSLVRGPDGTPRHFIAQVLDLGGRKAHEHQLREMARRDELTDLLNRRGFEEELQRHIAYVKRHGRTAALLMIDLDRFKEVNDAHGHDVGDDVLQAVAEAMRERLRKTDIAARLGGDEFAILLPETAIGQARRLASELGDLVTEGARSLLPDNGAVVASIGVTAFDRSVAVADVLRAADRDMYASKRRRASGPRFAPADEPNRDGR